MLRTIAACSLALALTAAPLTAAANPPGGPRRAPQLGPVVRRPGLPRPIIALQLTGLRVVAPVARAAIIHALGRDAWPALVRCVQPAPRVRGFLTVQIYETPTGTEPTFLESTVLRDRALAACLRNALLSVRVPPWEGERSGASFSFDLVFIQPPVGLAASLARR